MPISLRLAADHVASLPPLDGVEFRRETDPTVMALAQQRPYDTMRARFDDGHRAYVARRDGAVIAWGWVATRTAAIGEMGATFTIPRGERYLWNFVTLSAHRGRGIYPRMLQAILRAEGETVERFWIACAPENRASGSGIAKAGFTAQAELSFDVNGRPAVRPLAREGTAVLSRALGIRETDEALTPCWRCVRAGRGAMACAEGQCRCDYQEPRSGCAA